MPKLSLQKAFSEWRNRHHTIDTRADIVTETTSEISVDELYVPSERPSAESYLASVGFPGEFPYTRGIYPTMYRGRCWTMRQYAGFGTAREANERYRYLLEQGTSGLSVAFDLPTQMGRDSTHQLARGEVGRVGVAIDTVVDVERLFEGIPLGEVSTSMTINSTAHILLACYLIAARRQGVPWERLRGTVQNDVLKEYIARGTYIYPPKGALKITTDIFEFCKTNVPKWNTISISGYHIREAGSTAVQELAFTLANGIAYVQAAIDRGMGIDEFAPRLAFFFNCHNDFFEEVAKFRAARRMWARIVRERFSAKDDRSCMLRFHTQTAGSSLTAQDPQVNIIRTTIQALAAVLGGTQSLHTNSFDEALCLPTEESARIALRTQQVIAEESGVAATVDPLGGSYFLESLTDELEAKAEALIAKIDGMGGMVVAIESNFPQREIEDAAYRYQQLLEKGSRQVVGVNCYTDATEEQLSKDRLLKVDPGLEREQCQSLDELKASRDGGRVHNALETLRKAASEDRNIMPSVLAAVEEYASVGEISDVLRGVFGQYGQGS